MIRTSGLFLFLLIASYTFAQTGDKYQVLNQYHRFGITVGPTLYNKGAIKPQFGNYTFDNFNTVSFNAGFEYDFRPTKVWSVQTGVFIGHEPAYNISVKIPIEEFSLVNREDFVMKWKRFGQYSVSVPITFSIKKRIAHRLYGQLKTGFRMMSYQQGSASTSIAIESDDQTEMSQVFGLRMSTPETSIYGSYILGGGVHWASKWFLLKTDIVYTMNFKSILEGEYRFGNLLESEPSGGLYEMSGNYFALMFTVHFNRSKDKYE